MQRIKAPETSESVYTLYRIIFNWASGSLVQVNEVSKHEPIIINLAATIKPKHTKQVGKAINLAAFCNIKRYYVNSVIS